MFWIAPDSRLHNAHDSHLQNPPRGFRCILHDEPYYGGFLPGRIASMFEDQLVVVYCRSEAPAAPGVRLSQFVRGLSQVLVLVRDEALVISDNTDIYGTLAVVLAREPSPTSPTPTTGIACRPRA